MTLSIIIHAPLSGGRSFVSLPQAPSGSIAVAVHGIPITAQRKGCRTARTWRVIPTEKFQLVVGLPPL